jgi:hypothetical protein
MNKEMEAENTRQKKVFTGSDINTVNTHNLHSAIQANTNFITITCTLQYGITAFLTKRQKCISEFHCFTVHFNSLCVMVQLMHLFVIKH